MFSLMFQVVPEIVDLTFSDTARASALSEMGGDFQRVEAAQAE